MALRTRAAIKKRAPDARDDEARFAAWLSDFDARMAELTARQDRLLQKLGIEPVSGPAESEHA